jgi:tripartite-type tricarboxylate transporter receptor subunit TctC
MRCFVLSCVFAVSLLAVPTAQAAAQGKWPDRPVRLITPYAPGGSSTIVSRIVAAYLTELWGQQVIVDNRPGGNTIIGTQLGARANPDGYTLLFQNTTFALNHLLIRRLPYDSLKDFTPLANIYNNETILAIHPSVPANTLKEFIALAKSKPGALNYASSGNGTPYHMAGELFKAMAGVDLVHIPHKGSDQARVAVLGGQVQMMFDAVPTMASQARAGKVKALATSGTKRSSVTPDLPTLAEAGVPGYEAGLWLGLMAPAGTPRPILERLNSEINKVINSPEVKEAWAKQGTTTMGMSIDQFDKFLRDEIVKWAKVVKLSGAKAD